jgi:hypothetical protein
VKRLLIICGLAALILVPVAFAGHSQPLGFITGPSVYTAGCVTASGDYLERDALANSELSAGTTVTDSICVMDNEFSHAVHTQLGASSNAMVLTVAFSTGGSFTITPVFDKRIGLWMYRSCTPVPSTLSGLPLQATLSASNLSRRSVSKISYDWWAGPDGC